MPSLAPSLEQKCRTLAQVPIFSSLARGDLETLARATHTRRVAARDEVFHQGDPGSQLYVVAQGRLKVVTTSPEGDDLIFCVAEPGDVIGEIALLAQRPRTATLVAIQESQLLALDRRDLQALLHSRPDVAIDLLGVLARRLARLSEFVEDTHFLNLAPRLAKKIGQIAAVDGREREGAGGREVVIDLHLSQEEWGDLVGTTRESVNKQFREWRGRGLIAHEKGQLVVLDPDALEDLADCLALE